MCTVGRPSDKIQKIWKTKRNRQKIKTYVKFYNFWLALAEISGKTKKIDLHGHSLDEAHKKVELLINRSYEEGVEKIIVITGKGLRSKSGEDPYVSKDLSILKYSVPEFVLNNENLKNKIKNIAKAKIQDGGEGSFYIFLKKFKE